MSKNFLPDFLPDFLTESGDDFGAILMDVSVSVFEVVVVATCSLAVNKFGTVD